MVWGMRSMHIKLPVLMQTEKLTCSISSTHTLFPSDDSGKGAADNNHGTAIKNVACFLCEVKTGEIRRAQVNTRLSFLKTEGCPVTGKEHL